MKSNGSVEGERIIGRCNLCDWQHEVEGPVNVLTQGPSELQHDIHMDLIALGIEFAKHKKFHAGWGDLLIPKAVLFNRTPISSTFTIESTATTTVFE